MFNFVTFGDIELVSRFRYFFLFAFYIISGEVLEDVCTDFGHCNFRGTIWGGGGYFLIVFFKCLENIEEHIAQKL